MTDCDDSVRAAQSYAMAFKVGFGGTIILTFATLLGPTLPGLLALAVWSLATMFLLPWLYIFYCHNLPQLSYSSIRGPHQ